MDIKELLQRIHALIEEYLEIDTSNVERLKKDYDLLRNEYDALDDKHNILLDACNDLRCTLEDVE